MTELTLITIIILQAAWVLVLLVKYRRLRARAARLECEAGEWAKLVLVEIREIEAFVDRRRADRDSKALH